ncbi:MAG: indole-3-glycerol-phosphate synthase [Polyangiaceae bacterium]|nr:indole-3-glycerol-phosphate synthase [Polyangiaceae bacterium]
MGVLATILEVKRQELVPLRKARLPACPLVRPVDLARTDGEPLRLIAEIKRRSPSAGALSTRLSVAERAGAYARAGARMLSVLCDATFFDGSFQHLAEGRAACDLPLLCKEFVIDEVQIDAARAWGADAVLLIARCVAPERLERLLRHAEQSGLSPLVEIATQAEAELAVQLGARLVGVNARDLDTLEIDVARAERVLASLPRSVTAVHLSGVTQPAQVRRITESRADAALVGEVLMRQDDPEPLLGELVRAAGGKRM